MKAKEGFGVGEVWGVVEGRLPFLQVVQIGGLLVFGVGVMLGQEMHIEA
jgi:hypothetical protein